MPDGAGFCGACDGIANTLVLIRAKRGIIFGGFAVPNGESSGGHKKDTTKLSSLFILKNHHGDKPTRFPLRDGSHAIHCYANYPARTLEAASTSSYANPGTSYIDVLHRRGG
jgi:hypothetical protein